MKLNIADGIDFIAPSLDLLLISLDYHGYSRIADRIKTLWCTKECADYLKELLFDTRGNRRGFPLEVFETILEIHNLHHDVFYLGIDPESSDMWGIF